MTPECNINVVPRMQPGRFTGRICGEPATVRIESGCVHEHITSELVCAYHAAKLTAASAALACTDCWADGHYCAVLGRVAESIPGGTR